MELSNQTTIPLPQEVQKAVEAARNNVTLLRAEAERLQKLARDCGKEIKDLSGQKASLETQIANLSKDHGVIFDKHQKLIETHDSERAAFNQTQTAHLLLKKESADLDEQIADKKGTIAEREHSLNERAVALETAEQKADAERAQLLEKAEHIKELLHKLS